MNVELIRCSPSANDSEEICFSRFERELKSSQGEGEWILLANLHFSYNNERQSDEIDMIAIGPSGITVIEIKHWSADWMDQNQSVVAQEAEKISDKAKRIAGKLKGIDNRPFVNQVFVLTQDKSKVAAKLGSVEKGVRFHGLDDWYAAINFAASPTLDRTKVRVIAERLEPRSKVAIDGALRRFAGFVNLEIKSPRGERFHRVYKGVKTQNRIRGLLHLYDLSASQEKNVDRIAQREYEALRLVSRKPWAPQILDSFQPAPGYDGDMFFFSIVDPEAPNLASRARDQEWSSENRMKFAAESLTALAELHGSEPVVGSATAAMIHRNISTETVLVKYDDTPILTGLELARIDASKSIGTVTSPENPATAPEIIAQGLTAATTKSDVYSLSYCLATLFSDRDDDLSRQAAEILAEGTRNKIEARADLKEMIDSFHLLISERVDPQQPQEAGTPTAYLYWSAGQVVYFHGTPYRIIQSLGTGGIGRTWKVEQLDGQGLEPIGTIYVAKVTHNPEDGALALTAYSKARPYLADTPALATIFECASEWKENDFTALLEWKEGDPFKDLQGSFHEFDSPQEDSLRFLQQVLEGLSSLHNNNLIHGDISPANLIVSPGLDSLSLTDYDFVCNIGEPIAGQGTVPYSPDRAGNSNIASRSDDIFSLAASFFEVVFNPSYPNGDPRLPFEYDGNPDKSQGLNWDAIDKSQYPVLSNFLSRATNPDSDERYQTVESALHDLDRLPTGPYRPVPHTVLKQGHIERLIPLLESYPGSPLGNTETRGLDSPFAIDTYVRTPGFEDELEKDIEEKRVQLIIFCGNAGDGKTALLQHITTSIDLRITQSSSRIIEGTTSGGTQVLMNLDGSASWGSRSADEILDEFLQPFQDGPSASDAVHLLAINDGRLLEWISAVEYSKGSPTPLAQSLYNLLLEIPNGTGKNESHIRFVNLNDRSLVGRVDSDQNTITTDFLDELVDRLYGADRVSEIWAECGSCSASNHCAIYQSAGIFAPDGHPAWAGKDKKIRDKSRDRARSRLYDALQTVHLTGDIHITTRELRSTLVYILFGMHTCSEYHSGTMHSPTRYWDLAFEPGSEYRQGDLLASISRLDPALESSPRIDRKLRKKPSDDGQDGLKTYPNLTTGSARRRAYFEWSEEEIHLAGNGRDDLILARGRHTDAFKRLAYETDNSDICKELLRGVARLQRLPAKADSREERVPLLIQTKTKVETSFWVEKPVSSFELKTNLEDAAADGFVPRLHRQAVLIYHYNNGQDPELLHLGSELFHVLLELARGYQLGDVSTDDNFAHLSLFVKRLLREDDDELFAWNPMEEAVIYRISTDIQDAVDGPFQPLVISQSN